MVVSDRHSSLPARRGVLLVLLALRVKLMERKEIKAREGMGRGCKTQQYYYTVVFYGDD